MQIGGDVWCKLVTRIREQNGESPGDLQPRKKRLVDLPPHMCRKKKSSRKKSKKKAPKKTKSTTRGRGRAGKGGRRGHSRRGSRSRRGHKGN